MRGFQAACHTFSTEGHHGMPLHTIDRPRGKEFRVAPARLMLLASAIGPRAIIACLLVALACPAMAQTNFITNGNFAVTGTTTSFQFGTYNSYTPPATLAGWASTGYNFVFLPGSTAADDTYGTANVSLYTSPTSPLGGDFMAADSDYGTEPVTQTISGMTVGATYAISFAWAGAQQTGFTGATVDTWTVSLGSQSYTTPQVNVVSGGFSGWMNQSYDFTATSSSETLSFLAAGSPAVPPFALLANVTMFAVPEPGGIAIMVTGLGGLIGLARRRRSPAN